MYFRVNNNSLINLCWLLSPSLIKWVWQFICTILVMNLSFNNLLFLIFIIHLFRFSLFDLLINIFLNWNIDLLKSFSSFICFWGFHIFIIWIVFHFFNFLTGLIWLLIIVLICDFNLVLLLILNCFFYVFRFDNTLFASLFLLLK